MHAQPHMAPYSTCLQHQTVVNISSCSSLMTCILLSITVACIALITAVTTDSVEAVATVDQYITLLYLLSHSYHIISWLELWHPFWTFYCMRVLHVCHTVIRKCWQQQCFIKHCTSVKSLSHHSVECILLTTGQHLALLACRQQWVVCICYQVLAAKRMVDYVYSLCIKVGCIQWVSDVRSDWWL